MNYKEKYEVIEAIEPIKDAMLSTLWNSKDSARITMGYWKAGTLKKTSHIEAAIDKWHALTLIAINIQCTLTNAIRVLVNEEFNMIDYKDLMAFKIAIDDMISLDSANEQNAIENSKKFFNQMKVNDSWNFKLLIAKYLLR